MSQSILYIISNENTQIVRKIFMIMSSIQNIQYPDNKPTFTATAIKKEAVIAYRKLSPQFIKENEAKGVPQGLIVGFINRLLLKPNTGMLNPEKLCKNLTQKINTAFSLLKQGKTADEMSKILKTEKRRIEAFVNKQELLERNNNIAEAFLNGESIQELAQQYNLSIRCIGIILRDKGISPEKIAKEKRNTVIKMVKDNFTDEAIADTLGIPLKHIQSIRAHNKLLKNKLKTPNPKEQFIIEQLRSGTKREDLAAEAGISMNVINNVSKKFKVKETLLAERNAKIMEMLYNGIPTKTIAKEFNIDKTIIYKLAKKHNFQLS